jgi:alkanesulfonate monooxygenase SsuD/methylene tetrahydromethanopterin reductase-like flavin-dependent oxidoreductase (luciferase family)
MIGARLAARLADLMLANNVPNLGDFGAGFASLLKPGAVARESVRCIRRVPPSQPSPVNGGRGFVRVRATSVGPHPNLPPQAGEGASRAGARLRLAPHPNLPP